MKFRIVSETSDGMGIAERLSQNGDDAMMWIRSSEATEVGDGLVEKSGDLYGLLKDTSPKDTVFVFDSSGNGLIADYLRSMGYPVIGGSSDADVLEHDRQTGTKVMQSAGIAVPETFTFEDWDEGIDFVKSYDDRLVYKPAKQLGELASSHVSYDSEDMIDYLENTRKEVSMRQPEFQLQQFVKGTALSTECWFDGTSFIEPMWNHTLERKELMNGNIGPSGGCTGNVVWRCGYCPVCEQVRQLKKYLSSINYIGPVDLNTIVTKDGVYGLEFTPRFGYDATPTLLWELVDGEIGQLLADVARGQHHSRSPVLRADKYASGIRLTIPPWPSEKHHAEKGVPIRGLTNNDWSHTYLYNVKEDDEKAGEIVSAGAWGILLLFTGIGVSINGSFSKPEGLAEKVRIPDKQYRTDLAKSFEKDITELMAVFEVK